MSQQFGNQTTKPQLGFVNESLITNPKVYARQLYTNQLTLSNQTPPESGQVLVTDEKGNATWKNPGTLGIGGGLITFSVNCDLERGTEVVPIVLDCTAFNSYLKIVAHGVLNNTSSGDFKINLQPVIDLGYDFKSFQFQTFPVGTFRLITNEDEDGTTGNLLGISDGGYYLFFSLGILTDPSPTQIDVIFVCELLV